MTLKPLSILIIGILIGMAIMASLPTTTADTICPAGCVPVTATPQVDMSTPVSTFSFATPTPWLIPIGTPEATVWYGEVVR